MGKRRTRGAWFGVVVGAAGLAGCQTEDVSVGSEGSAIQLNRCFGENVDCRGFESATVAEVERKVCAMTPASPLTVDFRVEVVKPSGSLVCPTPLLEALAVADDESVWVEGREQCDDGSRVWLRHYTADGTLIGQNESVVTLAAQDTLRAVDLAAGKDGHVYVAIGQINFDRGDKDRFTDRLTIYEFDGSGVSTRAPIALGRLASTRLAVGPENALMVAGDAAQNEPRGLIARFRDDGEPLWIRNDIPTSGAGVSWGLAGLRVAADGASTTVSVRERDFDHDVERIGLSRVDARGTAIWDRLLSASFAAGNRPFFDQDDAGNVVVATVVTTVEQQFGTVVQQFSAAGESTWSFALPQSAGGEFAVQPDTGLVVIPSFGGALLIPADGHDCFAAAVSDADFRGGSAAFSKSGKLYFSDGYGFSRLTLPASE